MPFKLFMLVHNIQSTRSKVKVMTSYCTNSSFWIITSLSSLLPSNFLFFDWKTLGVLTFTSTTPRGEMAPRIVVIFDFVFGVFTIARVTKRNQEKDRFMLYESLLHQWIRSYFQISCQHSLNTWPNYIFAQSSRDYFFSQVESELFYNWFCILFWQTHEKLILKFTIP